MTKGKLIVIYGANNLGKSHQAEFLKNALAEKGIPVIRIKFPIYYIEPTGPKINAVLRQGLKLPEDEVQRLYVQNRWDFQSTLKSFLQHGTWIVAEDYVGTGIAWGLVRGLKLRDLERMNKGLIKEDLAIMLYGERFKIGIEVVSRNETGNQLWQKAQKVHLRLAKKYGWEKIYASRSEDEVFLDIWKIVKPILKK